MGNSAIRKWKWKLFERNKNELGRVVVWDPDKWELYNIEEDRAEVNDLLGRHQEIVQEFKAKYQQWAERCNVRP